MSRIARTLAPAALVALAGAVAAGPYPTEPLFELLLDPDQIIGGSLGTDVSADGSITVGFIDHSRTEAVRWTPGGVEYLGDLPGGYFMSEATNVSGDGQTVFGFSNYDRFTIDWGDGPSLYRFEQPFVWTEVGGMVGYGEPLFDWRPVGASDDGTFLAGMSIEPDGDEGNPTHWSPWVYEQNDPDLVHEVVQTTGGGELFDVARDGSMAVGELVESGTWWDQAARVLPDATVEFLPKVVPGTLDESSARVVTDGGDWIFGIEKVDGVRSAVRWSGDGQSGVVVNVPGTLFVPVAASYDGSVVADRSGLWTAQDGRRELVDILVQDLGLDLDGWDQFEIRAMSADGSVIVGEAQKPGLAAIGFRAVVPYSPCAGDVDGDGAVDVSDFFVLASAFGASGVGRAGGDLTGDAAVDVSDFFVLASGFGCAGND